MLQAVLLDYGHTIVDFALNEQALLATYEEVASLLSTYAGHAVPAAQELVQGVSARVNARIVESYQRQDLEELDIVREFDQALQALDLVLPDDLVRRIAAMEHRALAAETYLPPDHSAVLQSLRADGFHLALVSNVSLSGHLVRQDLDALGLLDLFDTVILSSEVGVRKPHQAIYQAALRDLNLPARDALFVGDRLREDIAGPAQAGMRAMLTHQFRQEQPSDQLPRPDAIMRRLSELPALARQVREERG